MKPSHSAGISITVPANHGLSAGTPIRFTKPRKWYVRMWQWLTRQKDPVFFITEVHQTSFTVAARPVNNKAGTVTHTSLKKRLKTP